MMTKTELKQIIAALLRENSDLRDLVRGYREIADSYRGPVCSTVDYAQEQQREENGMHSNG